MNDNELNRIADLIWITLFSIENSDNSKPQQLGLIKSIIEDACQDAKKIGRNQILNHIQTELDNLNKK